MTDDARARVIAEAQSWIDTPYAEQQAVKGVGCDCVGLVRGVGEAAGVLTVDPVKAAPFRGYPSRPRKRMIVKALDTFLVRVPRGGGMLLGGGPGDVLCFRLPGEEPSHLGILTGPAVVVHAALAHGRVVESEIEPELSVIGVWRYPGLVGDRP